MKTHFNNREDGNVLFITLVIAMLVGIVVAGLLLVSQQQNYLTARARTWASEIPIAEAGIEEAMAHLNSRPTLFDTNGWAFSGTNLVKQGTFEDGYYYTTIYTAAPPTVVAVGFGRIPLQTNFTRRTVLCTTVMAPPIAGIVAKGPITMNGSTAFVDSFDSSDPFNPSGQYTLARRRDRAVVASISSAPRVINTGNARIFGYAQTGPGGSAEGTVGDGTWCTTSAGIQPGHFRDDFNMAIPDVVLPTELIGATAPPLAGTMYVLGNGDYRMGNVTLGSLISMKVMGKARLYVAGDFKLNSGTLTITPNASLEIYFGGNANIGGNGVFNGAQVANKLAMYGLPTCLNLAYSGGSGLIAKVYAPQATITFTGGNEFCGSIVGNELRIFGTPALHYDEALNGSVEYYRVASWEEL